MFTIDSDNNIAAFAGTPASTENLETFATEKELAKLAIPKLRRGRKTSIARRAVGSSGSSGPSALPFRADNMPLFPDGRNAYGRDAAFGTLIKLYEYDATGYKSNIIMKDGLLRQLDYCEGQPRSSNCDQSPGPFDRSRPSGNEAAGGTLTAMVAVPAVVESAALVAAKKTIFEPAISLGTPSPPL